MIWGKKKKHIYKLDVPYIENTSNYDLGDFNYTEWDKLNLDLMDNYINDFLRKTINIGKKIQNISDFETTVVSQLMTTNKAYLIEKKTYVKFFKSLQDIDPSDRDTSLIIGLYPDILSSINNETLTKYINNLYSSLETLSKDINGEKTTWKEIHVEYPFLWLFIRISHLLLRNEYV